MAKLRGLAHVGLFVADLPRSIEFYNNMLDFETINECALDEADGTTTKIAFVKNGDLTIELIQKENPDTLTDGKFDHIAMAVEDIAAVRDMLAGRGIEFETEEIAHAPNVMPNGAKWILFRGPDNEHLEINEVL